jgi:hypothetical protein
MRRLRFLEAELACEPFFAFRWEDVVACVEAGCAGGFWLIIGIGIGIGILFNFLQTIPEIRLPLKPHRIRRRMLPPITSLTSMFPLRQ